ncbi:MAG: hypothetical protein NTV90_05240 [Actinobacteria bacterium]|nr:hypothetical protein [Actinomycetota bacterium]
MLNHSKPNFRSALVAFLAVILITGVMAPSTKAAETAGSKCTTLGKTVVKGKIKLTCIKVTEYKWAASPVKPALASIYNPVLPGNKFKIGTIQFQAGAVNFEFGDEVCRENGFNDGCVFNQGLTGSVDPDSPNRWIGVDLVLTNQTNKTLQAVDLNFTFYMILPDGKYIESAKGITYENSPIEITLPANKSTTMRIAYELPKTINNLNPILVVRDNSAAKAKEYFFYLNW